jgi:hypothetical protein
MANPDPSRRTRWRKGQSGNPSGKAADPEHERTVAETLKRLLHSRTLGTTTLPDGKLVIDALCEAMLKYALKGNAILIREILDRTEGRVPLPAPAAAAGEPRDDCVIVVPSARTDDGADDPPLILSRTGRIITLIHHATDNARSHRIFDRIEPHLGGPVR